MKIAKNIIAVLIVIMLIIGIIMTASKGINIGLLYRERQQIGFVLGKQFEAKDIRKIAEEVFENEDYLIQKATIFEDTVIIQNEEITKENIQAIVEKVNAKYDLKINAEEIEVEKVGARNVEDDLSKYILPSVISIVLITVYFGLRFKKLGVLRTIIRFITTVIFIELFYISILSITQIEIGRLLAPIGFGLYMLSVVASTVVFEKERKNLIELEENKN